MEKEGEKERRERREKEKKKEHEKQRKKKKEGLTSGPKPVCHEDGKKKGSGEVRVRTRVETYLRKKQ